MNFRTALLTNNGRSLISAAVASNKIIWTSIGISSVYLASTSDAAIRGMTSMSGVFTSSTDLTVLPYKTAATVSGGMTTGTGGYAANIVLYGRLEDQTTATLVAIAPCTGTRSYLNPTDTFTKVYVNMGISITDATTVQVLINQYGYASISALNEANNAIIGTNVRIDELDLKIDNHAYAKKTYDTMVHAACSAKEGEEFSVKQNYDSPLRVGTWYDRTGEPVPFGDGFGGIEFKAIHCVNHLCSVISASLINRSLVLDLRSVFTHVGQVLYEYKNGSPTATNCDVLTYIHSQSNDGGDLDYFAVSSVLERRTEGAIITLFEGIEIANLQTGAKFRTSEFASIVETPNGLILGNRLLLFVNADNTLLSRKVSDGTPTWGGFCQGRFVVGNIYAPTLAYYRDDDKTYDNFITTLTLNGSIGEVVKVVSSSDRTFFVTATAIYELYITQFKGSGKFELVYMVPSTQNEGVFVSSDGFAWQNDALQGYYVTKRKGYPDSVCDSFADDKSMAYGCSGPAFRYKPAFDEAAEHTLIYTMPIKVNLCSLKKVNGRIKAILKA